MNDKKKVILIVGLYIVGTFVLSLVLLMALLFTLRGDHKAMRQRQEAI